MARNKARKGSDGLYGDVSIRPVKLRDIDNIRSLEKRMFPSLHNDSHGSTAVAISAAASVMRGAALVAEVKKRFAGFANGWVWTGQKTPSGWKGDVFLLNGIAVEPALQRKGVGAELLKAIYERALSRGCKAVIANVDESSRAFYEREGWTVSGIAGQSVSWLESPRVSNKVLPQDDTPFAEASAHVGQPPNSLTGFDLMAFKKLTDEVLPAFNFGDGPEESLDGFAKRAAEDDAFLSALHPCATTLLTQTIKEIYGPEVARRVAITSLGNGTARPEDVSRCLGALAA